MARSGGVTGPLAVLTSTDGPDVWVGSGDTDLYRGQGGDDVLWGRGGDDQLSGDDGADQLHGEDGNDNLSGGAGSDQLYGDDGDDYLTDSESGSDQLLGGAGHDRLILSHYNSEGGAFLLSGGEGDDSIRVSVSRNVTGADIASITGGEGDDEVIMSGALGGTVDLGAGNDFFSGGTFNSVTVAVGAGHDTILANQRGQTIVVQDFAVGEYGDRIDLQTTIERLTSGNNPEVNPFFSGVARLTQSGADTLVWVGSAVVFRLSNVTATSLTPSNFGGWSPTGGSAATGGNFWGGNRSEQIWASHGPDRIEGLGGDDSLLGRGGDDVILGGAGSDHMDGGAGSDVLYGGDGRDFFDEYVVSGGNDVYHGEGGSDSVRIQDRSNGAGERVEFFGGDGDDYLSSDGSRLGDLVVDGGAGADSIGVGNVDRWRFDGGAGDDQLGLASAYRNATLFWGTGTFEGGLGRDFVVLDEQSRGLEIVGVDARTFRIGTSTMRDVEGVRLTGLADQVDLSRMTHGLILDGDTGADVLTGSAFDDVLIGGMGDDRLDGGAGYDTAVFDQARSEYVWETVGGATTVRNIGAAADIQGSDVISGIERLQFADGWYDLSGARLPAVVTGTAAGDVLRGEGFSDTVQAGAGDDVIHSSAGKDVVYGGTGDDLFEVAHYSSYFRLQPWGDDFILSGPGGSTRLIGVETVRFMDGVVLELNRMYGEAWDGSAPSPETLPPQPPQVQVAPMELREHLGLVQHDWRAQAFDSLLSPSRFGIDDLWW